MKDSRLLDRVLAARDARAHQRRWLWRSAGTAAVGELSLNVPGWPKRGHEWRLPFLHGLRAFVRQADDVRVLARRSDDAGYWAVLAGPAAASAYKASACRVEAAAPWGRLLDFDWYAQGHKLTREALGLPPRTCWICGGEQAACISTLEHPLAESRARALALAHTVHEPSCAQSEGTP